MDKIIKRAIIDALGTALYVTFVASVMFSFQSFSPQKDAIIIPIAMLLLFVSSAAITGFLVFGKPIMLYIDGKKREAMALLAYTFGILVLITILALVLLIVHYR